MHGFVRKPINSSVAGDGEPSAPRRKPNPVFRFLRMLLVSCVAAYVAVCLIVAYYQRSYIYFPHVLTAREVDQSASGDRLERWNNSAGQPIGMKRPTSRRPAVGQVLITYGNGSWTVGSAHYADEIQNLADFDVYILEYPGYADRPGSPTETSIFRAADEAFRSLDPDKPTYLLGESLGSGVACYLAGTHPDQVAGVILLSPFDRLTSVGQEQMPYLPVRLLQLDRFPSIDYLRAYHGPLGIMVDGRDEVVPAKFGINLYDSYAGPKQLWTFKDGGHISILDPPAKFWGEVLEFWRVKQKASN
jgi:pimeloyl-ACP methyl ester carboxylesterase